MNPLYLKTVFAVVFTLGSMFGVRANGLSEVRNLKSWLKENRIFVEAQFQLLELPVEATFDSEVAFYIERYLRPGRHGTERMLGKAAYYFPIFEAELAARRLPEGLKYLPVVESALQPGIESPVGARGLWQFMPATADFFDLQIDEWVDERHDPHLSSAAAAELLSFLYKQFDDWNLALAAYNCGPGRVKRAIRRAGIASYEAIKEQLPRQTQRYITKFKAAAYVMAYHQFFGLKADPDSYLPEEVERLALEESMTFEEIAERAGVSVEVVRALNPAFLQDVVPAGAGKPFHVLVPAEAVPTWVAGKKKKEELVVKAEETREAYTAGSSALSEAGAMETPLPELPAINVQEIKWSTWERPLRRYPPNDDDPKESMVVWFQRQGILESLTIE